MRVHRSRPSVLASLAVAGATLVGTSAATVAAEVATAPAAHAAAPPTDENFAKLRWCESHNDYWANSGNGYYGAYQFSASTWHSLGYSGTANQWPWWVQNDAAARLQSQRGWSPWPACARAMGLN